MGQRILITGITGFVGSHLADALLESDDAVELFGIRRFHRSRMDHVRHVADRVRWVDADLTDPVAAARALDLAAPDRIFHFAAESFVSPSWDHPSHYMRVNYDATVNVLEALRQSGSRARILIPGSGEEYGDVPESELPITERTPLQPVNPYAVTKVAQDLVGLVYFRSHGTQVIRTRAFNHEGPRRDNVFGIPSYASQIARIEHGRQAPIVKTGHLDDRRNFTHVRDVVKAYRLAIELCEPGRLYLIGSEGEESVWSFRRALEHLIALSTVEGIRHEVEAAFVRPTSVPRLVADTSTFRALTGWQPRISMEAILSETLEYWRMRERECA